MMKNKIYFFNFFLFVFITFAGINTRAAAPLAPTGLMIDLHRNDAEPILISDNIPEFSWIVNDSDSDEIQTAYQIIIATTQENINNNVGDFYDTKKVLSEQSVNIRYSGPGFLSGKKYFWKVKTWDKEGLSGEWSQSGAFIKALSSTNWTAKPIWCSGTNQYTFLRKKVMVQNKDIVSAIAFVSGRHTEGEYPRPVVQGGKQYTFKFYVNDSLVGIGPYRFRGDNQYAAFDITDKIIKGSYNVLASVNKSTRDEKDFVCQVNILFTDGTKQTIITDNSWKALPAQNIFNPTGNTSGLEGNDKQYYYNPYEEIDGTKWPNNWRKVDFDDSGWSSAISKPMYKLRPGQIRNLRIQKMPITVKKLNSTDYEIVVDVHTCGWMDLKLKNAPENNSFTIYYPKEEKDAKTLTWKTAGGDQNLEEFGYSWRKNVLIKGYTGPELTADNIDYYAIGAAFDPEDTKFTSSENLLNDIFRICKNSMEFNNLDIYMDSPTRQRSPFPGDGVINLRTHYTMSRDYGVGRYSMEYFLPMKYSSYPEYGVQIINMAYIDYMYTGSTKFIETFYSNLKDRGSYLYNGSWITMDALVDHPTGYKDDYDFNGSPDNVVHSWNYGALRDLAKIAALVGNTYDKNTYNNLADKLYTEYNKTFWNSQVGKYRDGGGSNHYSIHASFFPASAGLLTKEKQKNVADFLRTQPLNCNVYGAQSFWDALYNMEEGDKAMQLFLTKAQRSYYNMIHVLKSTTAAETWDRTNLTRSHPWGSAGGNLLVGSTMGIHALAPSFSKIGVKPQTADLKDGSVDFMSIRGSIHVDIKNENNVYTINTKTPANTSLKVFVPVFDNTDNAVMLDGELKIGIRQGNFLIFDDLGSGEHTFVRNMTGGIPGYVYAGEENSTVNFPNYVDVAFGTDGKYQHKEGATGDVVFTAENFPQATGTDRKVAYYRNRKAIPDTIKAIDYDAMNGVIVEAPNLDNETPNLRSFGTGDWVEYNIYVDTQGMHQFKYQIASKASFIFKVLIDGVEINSIEGISTGGLQNWNIHENIVDLSKGNHTLRLEVVSGTINLKNIYTNNDISINIPENQEKTAELKIYPNPSTGVFRVISSGLVSYKLYSLTGRVLLQNKASDSFTLNASAFSKGMYILEVKSENKHEVKRTILCIE